MTLIGPRDLFEYCGCPRSFQLYGPVNFGTSRAGGRVRAREKARVSEAFGAVVAGAGVKMCVLAQFPVDLHAGPGETARPASPKRRFLPGEVLIDPASAGVGSVVFSGSLLGASTGSYRRGF